MPITLGLRLASGWILMGSVNRDWRGYLLTLLTVGLVIRTRWNPLWLIAAGGHGRARLSAPVAAGSAVAPSRDGIKGDRAAA